MKLPEIGVRLRLFTNPDVRGRRLSFAIRVRLTGAYDKTRYANGLRVSHVEIEIDSALAWVSIDQLENAWDEPLSYRDLRRALLVLWINGSRDADAPATADNLQGVH